MYLGARRINIVSVCLPGEPPPVNSTRHPPWAGISRQRQQQYRKLTRRSITAQCSASAAGQFGRSQDSSALQSDVPALVAYLRALYQFSRPHTMLGTFISICSVSLLAMVSHVRHACTPCSTHSRIQVKWVTSVLTMTRLLWHVCIM